MATSNKTQSASDDMSGVIDVDNISGVDAPGDERAPRTQSIIVNVGSVDGPHDEVRSTVSPCVLVSVSVGSRLQKRQARQCVHLSCSMRLQHTQAVTGGFVPSTRTFKPAV